MTDLSHPPIDTSDIRIVDEQGNPRILLSARDGTPSIRLLRDDGTAGMSLALDAAGRPAVTLVNPLGLGPTAALEIDDKGAHVKLDRPGGASAYLFLNDAGASGLVLIDAAGKRRLNAIVAADGAVTIERLNDDGEPLP